MANVAHSTLTGVDLHESKGTAAAAVSTIFVADGAGSGSYQKVPAAALAAGANPFGAQLLHVREEQSAGVASSTGIPHGAVGTIVLNTTVTNEISGASLSSNQVTLPAGTYYARAAWSGRATISSGSNHVYARLRLWNNTASALLVGGTNSMWYGAASAVVGATAGLEGRFTLGSTSVLLLQGGAFTSGGATVSDAVNGSVGMTGNEVYSSLHIWKVA